jgi:hypothetical protein
MLEIQRTTLTKAIKLLNSIGAEYAIIVGEEKHGALEVVTKKQKTTHGKKAFSHLYGRNVLRDYVKPYIDPLKVGDVARIPPGQFMREAIAASAASYAHQLFGRGGHTGRQDHENNVYELLRLEN